jgi:hypothetical protein
VKVTTRLHLASMLRISGAVSLRRTCINDVVKVKGKLELQQSLYRPGQARRVPGSRSSQISRQPALEGGKYVSPRHRPPVPPGNIPSTHFFWRLIRPQGHSAAQKDYVNENFQGHHRESNPRTSINDVDRDKFTLYNYDHENNIKSTVHVISKGPQCSRSVILEQRRSENR